MMKQALDGNNLGEDTDLVQRTEEANVTLFPSPSDQHFTRLQQAPIY
jgi:hypothetical protein